MMAEVGQERDRTSLMLHQAIQQESDGGGHGNTPSPLESPEVPRRVNQFRLTCPICLDDIKRPKQLDTCFHIFCADCLKQIIQQAGEKWFKCPTCVKPFTPPEDVSTWLDTDAYLHAFQGQISLYAESGSASCSDTGHDSPPSAAFFCLECGRNWCDDCKNNHDGNDDFKSHHTLKLFRSPTTMTVGTGKREVLDEVDTNQDEEIYQCPICRNTDICEHLKVIEDLRQDDFRKSEYCLIPSHIEGNRLIAYCMECSEPICRNCSAIEHKTHETVNIETAVQKKLPYVLSLKKKLEVRRDIFQDAAQSARRAKEDFLNHIYNVQREMVERKGRVQSEVENAFNKACNIIEETGQKTAAMNHQVLEMRKETGFIRAAVNLAELASRKGTSNVEIVRIWKGIDFLNESMGGETDKKNAKVADPAVPQEIKEKRLVLPAPNCMTPDLSILEKVGVEGSVLELSFSLMAELELLMFYSILPLTDTEALVACQIEACKSAVVSYDNVLHSRGKTYSSVILKEEGQYCIAAVPGNGIVATHYKAGACSNTVKKQVLFWDQALDWSVAELERRGAGKELVPFAKTDLPPRGIAVTKENHLVVCTATDPVDGSGDVRDSCILLMTLKGDILKRASLSSGMGASSTGGNYFPRYATVNINGDICVTDATNRSLIILDGQLRRKLDVRNPYVRSNKQEEDAMNRKFMPLGICHDSFGRLIVVDAGNNAIIRFEIQEDGNMHNAHTILQARYGNAQDMYNPKLVALGPGPKLWVVCHERILVFHYMDKE